MEHGLSVEADKIWKMNKNGGWNNHGGWFYIYWNVVFLKHKNIILIHSGSKLIEFAEFSSFSIIFVGKERKIMIFLFISAIFNNRGGSNKAMEAVFLSPNK